MTSPNSLIPIINSSIPLVNNAIPVINNSISHMNEFLLNLSYIVGGLFGFTIMMFIYKIWYNHKIFKKVNLMMEELDYLKKKIDYLTKEKKQNSKTNK